MADQTEHTISLTNTYQPRAWSQIDQSYAEAEQAFRSRSVLTGAIQEPGKPSELDTGLLKAWETAKGGWQNILQGLGQATVPLPGEGLPGQNDYEVRMQGLRKAVVDGVLQMGIAPFVGGGAVTGQTAENRFPELAQSEFLDSGAAFTVRHILKGMPAIETIPPDELAQMREPMTVREAIELATTAGLMMAAPSAVSAIKGKIAELPQAHAQAVEAARGVVKLGAPGIAGPEAPMTPSTPRPPGMPAVPPGIPSRVNLERIQGTEAVKQTIEDLNKFAGERLAEHRKPQSHAEQLKGMPQAFNLNKLLAEEPETILLEGPKAQGLRDALNISAEYYDTLLRRRAGGEELQPGQLKVAFATAVRLAELDEANGRNLARGLELRKELSQSGRLGTKMTPERILGAADKLGDLGLISDDVLAMRSNLLTPAQRANWIKQTGMGLAYGKDVLHAAWIQTLLTNPVTHARNLATPLFTQPFEFLERIVAEQVNRIGRETDGVAVGETTAMLRSQHQAIADGIRLAAKSWETGQHPFEAMAKTEIPRLSPELYGLDPSNPAVASLNVLAKALESKYAPTRSLIVEDAFWKGIMYRQEISALALREATAENLIGRAKDLRIAELEIHPTAAMVVEAQGAAVRGTLNQPLGQIGQAIATAINAVPGGRVVAPFYRWSANAAKWTWQRTPVLAELSIQNWNDILGPDAAVRDRAIARVLVGHAVAYAISYEIGQGNITGAQIRARKEGLTPFQEGPPNSIRIGGKWWDLSVMGPVGQMMALQATYAELRRDIPEHRQWIDDWAAGSEAFALAAGYVFVNQTAMTGVANALQSITDPDKKSEQFVKGFARSLVPAGVRAVARAQDENIIREMHTVNEAIRSGIPKMLGRFGVETSDTVPPNRNPVTGEVVHYPVSVGPQLLSPVMFTQRLDTIWGKEIRENHIPIPTTLPWTIGGAAPPGPTKELLQTQDKVPGVELTPAEHDLWTTLMTQTVRIDGRTFVQELEHLMRPGSDYWLQSSGAAGGRSTMVMSRYSAYRDRGEYVLRHDPALGSPNLETAIRRQQDVKRNQKRPITDPLSPQFIGQPSPPPQAGPLGRMIESLRP